MYCKVRSLGLHGVTGYPVTAECDLSGGLPNFTIVGLPDAAVKNCGYTFPVSRITVNRARAIQTERYGADGPSCNAHMGQKELQQFCALDESGQALMKGAFDRMGLTARSHDRILRVARTIADLDNSENVEVHHLAEAIQYRSTAIKEV